MIIYRVEHPKTGIGPYNFKWNEYIDVIENDVEYFMKEYGITLNDVNHAFMSTDLGYKHSTSDSIHSSGIKDELKSLGKKFKTTDYCGFNSFSAYYKWFNDSFDILIEYGYQLSKYEVDEAYVTTGINQLAFSKDKAKLLSMKNIVDTELDERFSEEFNYMLFDRYEDPDYFTMRIVGETTKYYYLEITSELGIDQIAYDKEDCKWEFVN